LYSRVDVSRVFEDFSRDVANKNKICYARLSSDHQREKSQVGIPNRFYSGIEIIKDIGSVFFLVPWTCAFFQPSIFDLS
jgi:predicted site-specific integrase-resolvase